MCAKIRKRTKFKLEGKENLEHVVASMSMIIFIYLTFVVNTVDTVIYCGRETRWNPCVCTLYPTADCDKSPTIFTIKSKHW